MPTSLYIHIPFCKRKCLYCDFYSVLCEEGLAGEYVDIITGQIGRLEEEFSTIYVGGGTPSVLDVGLLKRLLRAVKKRQGAEFIVEANPESLTRDKIRLFLDSGVNRISIGVQSLRDKKLKKLGRLHNASAGRASIDAAVRAGFDNISIDLIFGVWGESPEEWRQELSQVSHLPVQHVSAYSLTYERGTPLFETVRKGSVRPLEDEAAAGMYETAIDILGLGGFKQYEVSNFAKKGYECRHNLNYWDNSPYIGIGASAVSYIDGARSRNVPDVSEYIRRARAGERLTDSSERLSPVRRAKETAALKIRTKEGIDFTKFRANTGFDFMKLEGKAIEKLLSNGLVKYLKKDNTPSGIALKRKGFLFCDTASSALL